jgi:Flp pilus assembly protein TadD
MSARALLFLLLLIFATEPAVATQEPKARGLEASAPAAAQEYSRAAIAAMGRGDLDAAERDFKRVLLLVPGNVPTMLNLGLIAHRRKDYARAETLLKSVTRAEPENGLPWLLLGIVHFDRDELDAALAALAQAVFYSPKDARAHRYLGVTAGKKGWYFAAEDELRKAIALDPDHAEAHYNLAAIYLQRTPPAIELARRHYEASLDLGGARDAGLEKRLADSGK